MLCSREFFRLVARFRFISPFSISFLYLVDRPSIEIIAERKLSGKARILDTKNTRLGQEPTKLFISRYIFALKISRGIHVLGTSQIKFNNSREYAVGLIIPRLDRIDRQGVGCHAFSSYALVDITSVYHLWHLS